MNDANLLDDQPIAWTPTPEVIERAQITRFMKQVGVTTWDELYQYSIADVERFTVDVLKFLDIRFDPPYQKLLDTSNGIEFPTWFRNAEGSADTPVRMSAKHEKEAEPTSDSVSPGNLSATPSFAGGTGDADRSVRAPSAGLNITEMCLDRWQTDEMRDQPAVIWEGEDGRSKTLSYVQLMDHVIACSNRLIDIGLKQGDAIGIHLPMIPETVVALIAIARIGAIAVPVFSGYGIDAITSRMEAVGAKALFTCFGTSRRGKAVDMLTVAARAVANVQSIESVILVGEWKGISELGIIGFMNEQQRLEKEVFAGRKVTQWRVNGDLFDLLDDNPTAKTSAEDPLIILYTSGTTGKPKGIAHTHSSFPIKAAQDMAFGTDVGKGTRISWYTDIGWMMGPWLIYGALINGATICIYDGAPDYPTPDRMWEFCAKHKVEILGISPTLIRSLSAAEGRADTLERSADTPVRMDAAAAFTKTTDTEECRVNERSAGHEDETQPLSNSVALESKTTTPSFAGGTGDADMSVRTPSAGTDTERRGWYRHKLPHFDGTVTQFITFRLADALPKSVIEKMKYRLEHDMLTDYSEEYREMVEQYLDAGAGECILRDPAVAELVQHTIIYEHGNTCDVKAWVIMPNHVHIMLLPYEGLDLAGIMKRIKGFSARKINQHLGRNGTVWQADYFDRYIRDEYDYLSKLQYIENNPVSAKLVDDAASWKFSSAYGSVDTPVRMSAKHEKETQPTGDSSSTNNLSNRLSFAEGSADTPVRMSAKHEKETQPTGDSSSTNNLSNRLSFAEGSADTPVRMSAKHEKETQPTGDSSSTNNLSNRLSFAEGSADTPVRMSAKHEKETQPTGDSSSTNNLSNRLSFAEGSADTPVRMSAKHEKETQPTGDSSSTNNLSNRLSFAEGSADTPVRMSAKHEKETQPSSDMMPPETLSTTPSFAGETGDADRSVRSPFERHDLSSLRAFASTGEPWNPAPWWWLFEKVGNSKLPIINYSGGTEISGGILMGNMLLPQKPCSFPAPCPGMDVDIVNEEGRSVGPGEVGELVIKQPWIGMARGFWQERERYLETYWRRFKNIWVHGDWAMRDKDGHWFILGRSDDTLKVAGKRVGPAEVESILVSHPDVTEAAVIGVPDDAKGTAMVAFCVLSDISPQRRRNAEQNQIEAATDSQEGGLAPALAAELKALVARDMGKPLAPSKIHFVSALPKTRNAKVMRRVIRSAYLGLDPGDISSLEDPSLLKDIENSAAAK